MRMLFNNWNTPRSRKGFTLSEVLISVGLMAFVATAAIGGLVVLNRVRDIIDKQNKAEMIMIATVCYLRSDLNSCTNPCDMDCSGQYYPLNDNKTKFGPVFYKIDPSSPNYVNIIIRDASYATIATTTGSSPKVQYWNATSLTADPKTKVRGICVGVQYDSITAVSSIHVPENNRKYILAQNVMQGTGMYSIIGGYQDDVPGDKYFPGKINFDEETAMFYFTVDVIDEVTGNVVMSQKVNVCPDALVSTANNNP